MEYEGWFSPISLGFWNFREIAKDKCQKRKVNNNVSLIDKMPTLEIIGSWMVSDIASVRF